MILLSLVKYLKDLNFGLTTVLSSGQKCVKQQKKP